MKQQSILIIGGGVLGISSALALQKRGFQVTLLDRQAPPHPEASSTDISKIVRADYGSDDLYADLMELAWASWKSWRMPDGELLFRQVGVLMLSQQEMQAGGYEYESFTRMAQRGHAVERMLPATLHQRFPFFSHTHFADGYFNPHAGWSPSSRVISFLMAQCQAAGVQIRMGEFAELLEKDGRIGGVICKDGERYSADWVILSMGAWTPHVVPELHGLVKSVGQPVVHFLAQDPAAQHIPAWGADIPNSGWYGFPATAEGVFKVGNHGPGFAWKPSDPLEVPSTVIGVFREFVERTFPSLRGALVHSTRLCLYCDTFDGNFWIDHHPQKRGLLVAAGGSGHAFKFAPVIGDVVADVLEGKQNPFAPRFAWRTFQEGQKEQLRAVVFGN